MNGWRWMDNSVGGRGGREEGGREGRKVETKMEEKGGQESEIETERGGGRGDRE